MSLYQKIFQIAIGKGTSIIHVLKCKKMGEDGSIQKDLDDYFISKYFPSKNLFLSGYHNTVFPLNSVILG